MKKFLLILCLLCLPVYADDRTWIEDNHDGKVIITPEYIVVIDDYYLSDTALWLPSDDVLITDTGYIINLDEGEKAEIQAINYR